MCRDFRLFYFVILCRRCFLLSISSFQKMAFGPHDFGHVYGVTLFGIYNVYGFIYYRTDIVTKYIGD
jgi:hypothetical protein